MLSIHNQKSNVSDIFIKNILSEIISRIEAVDIVEYDFGESIEIDKLQVDKIYLSLIFRLTLKG